MRPSPSSNHFLSLSRQDYAALMERWGAPGYRVEQLWQAIYQMRIACPDEMTTLPRGLTKALTEEVDFSLPKMIERVEADDQSTKILLQKADGRVMESVIMRYEGRTSLCVSSQVGCRMSCAFCQTGKLGFMGNLALGDILSQYFVASALIKEEGRRISHVVFMGMGEPLDNFAAAVGAANRLTDPTAFGLSVRHVTISTVGMAPQIVRLADESRVSLAVSLHAARDELRTELMPLNQRFNLAMLKESLKTWQQKVNRKIMIEYILIKDKNCGLVEAKELVKFLSGLKVKVNLIPFNPHPGLAFSTPDAESIALFQGYLSARSIAAPVRYSRGLDVSAACGQLAAKVDGLWRSGPDREQLLAMQHIQIPD